MAIFSAINAGKARKAQVKAQKKMDAQIANRQDIINPYENVTDLSNMISNPFSNLQVATKAAEIKIEEADISLANTLDTLRATGAGASGATALAQAALRGKQGVAATIDVLGKTFMFQAREQRDVADISRSAAMVQQYGQQRADALGAMGANIGEVASAFAGGWASTWN